MSALILVVDDEPDVHDDPGYCVSKAAIAVETVAPSA